ncbi:MAG: type II toxin-antitoxin system VapC family toxin [Candidatus Bathyarchaeia archaeon]
MRLYLEPSVLVKLFKREPGSEKMISIIDVRRDWFGCTSRWSLLEIARALKKDGKTRELVELDLKELRRHKLSFIDVTRAIISEAESIRASHNLYASDALHVATFESGIRSRRLDAMLTDDLHIQRLEGIAKVVSLKEISI